MHSSSSSSSGGGGGGVLLLQRWAAHAAPLPQRGYATWRIEMNCAFPGQTATR